MSDEDGGKRKKKETGLRAEFLFCRKFRKWAKRATRLPVKKDEDCGHRTLLLEELWDFASDLQVWGTADELCTAIRAIYDGHDDEAAEILNKLADDELEQLRSSDSEEEGEEGDQGPR